MPERFWDADKKTVKADDLGTFFKDAEARTKADADRAAQMPATANDYKVELPSDFKLPDGWQVDPSNPMWRMGAEFAKANNLDQKQFSAFAKLFIESQMQMTAKAVEQRDAEFKKLGDSGAARIQAVHTFIDATAGSPEKAAAIKASLINSDVVSFVEGLQAKLASAGITSFARGGEVPAKRSDGKPDNWDQMSAIDRLTWTRVNNKAA